jgi:V/A-type H+-transporting ATPase subunit A
VEARPLPSASLYELVYVGEKRLLGEVVRVEGDRATAQVYEETAGLSLGEPVEPSGRALSVRLGPGLLGAILDGVGRPLAEVARASGHFIRPGVVAPTLDPARRWAFEPALAAGARVEGGDALGFVAEGPSLRHPILVPPETSGVVASIAAGQFSVDEPIGALENGAALRLAHDWPVRRPRPFARRLPLDRPFVTGQRVFDLLFPIAEGGSVTVPGGFGTGKTVVEHSLARYAEADVVVFVACGERGNEMADALATFRRLADPRTGAPLLDRTVLVVNTSNMPVAAREASVYLGFTIAEYYRDLGLRVAVLADSLSRWAEALREIAARLREMPGEEAYPTHLANRLGRVYERAGRVLALGRPPREGSLTFVSAISPPGGDLSEPVTQGSLRVAGALWALDVTLAQQRQFPAVDCETSYSLYAERLGPWFAERVRADWPALRQEALALLEKDREVREVAALVGPDALQDPERLAMEAARALREAVLGQHAFDPEDARSTLDKTGGLAALVRDLWRAGQDALRSGSALSELDLPALHRLLAAVRTASAATLEDRARRAAAAMQAMAVARPVR